MPLNFRQSPWKLCACAMFGVSGAAAGAVYPLPVDGDDLVGGLSQSPILPSDTLAGIAFRYGLGFREVIKANPGMNPWQPGLGRTVRLPTAVLLPPGPREGIVVNVSEMRLYYYPAESQEVRVYPIAVGRDNWPTSVGSTWVREKVKDPVWYPPESIRAEHALLGDPLPRAVPPGPDNPLGNYALRLGWASILIHGTNKPLGGIGMPVTHGCVRMYPQDIETMFNEVPVGTRVRFVDERYKLGLYRGRWQLEAHPPLIEDPTAPVKDDVPAALEKLKAQAAALGAEDINWDAAEVVLRAASGYPQPVGPEPVLPLRVLARSAPAPKKRSGKSSAPRVEVVEAPAVEEQAAAQEPQPEMPMAPRLKLRLEGGFSLRLPETEGGKDADAQ